MKKIFTTLLFTAITCQLTIAQNNNLIVYSQEGLKFSVILNGIRQNREPQTNVKITGLNASNYQLKIIFNDKTLQDLDQNAYLMYGGQQTQNTEYTYAIVRGKEQYKLRFRSAAPMPEAPISDPEQSVSVYTPVEQVSSTTTTTTTTTNSVGSNGDMNGQGMGMNVNAPGIGISVNIPDMNGMGGDMNTTTTTTTTHTTTTTVSNDDGYNRPVERVKDEDRDRDRHRDNREREEHHYVLEGYNGVYGCPYPMSASDFESAKASVKSKSFDDSKLTVAKEIIGSNCMLCSQIKELMLLITFEQTRLDLAKFAWNHNLDKGNYYKLNDAFTFDSSVDELNKYTQSH